ncbi:HetZ-related protein [Oscillatoria acuminata]|nr:HetZ-related protein [Oscillatoria acuminata]
MNVKLANSSNSRKNDAQVPATPQMTAGTPQVESPSGDTTEEPILILGMDTEQLSEQILDELSQKLKSGSKSAQEVALRIAKEVERICRKSNRIQNSGEVRSWQITLARHRLQKSLHYYKLGSRQGRVDLHAQLSSMVYRHVAHLHSRLSFQARYTLIEDFLQGFYIEVLRAFRREHEMPLTYTPRTQLELAEYMAFTEHYAKRRITLPGRYNQQLIVLRAQGFAQGQPPETLVDIEQAIEFPKGEDAEVQSRSYAAQQVREKMISEMVDPAEAVLRDRVVAELIQYLESQGQSDCIDYLVLKLQDLAAPEIDEILGLSARQRDYLQQRFKYHVEKFARSGHWKLVHQWLGADLDQNLGMPLQQWDTFLGELSEEQQQLLNLKRSGASDAEIAQEIKCTPKQVQKRWSALLEKAWQSRNTDSQEK